MEYDQAPIECDIYLQLPDGIETDSGNSRTHMLKLLQKVYGQKQAGKVWADFLSENDNLRYRSKLAALAGEIHHGIRSSPYQV